MNSHSIPPPRPFPGMPRTALRRSSEAARPLAPVLAVAAALAVFGAAGAAAQDAGSSRLEPVLPAGSPFHGVHGLRFDARNRLHAASVIGQSIFTVDVDTGSVELLIGPPEGMADDIAFGPDGTMVWTAIEDGILYTKAPDGPVRRRVENMKGVNAVSFSPDGQRLYFTLVFYGDALYEIELEGSSPPRLIAENLGGLNAFEVADDGAIFGPLVFGGAVVRVDPDTGEVSAVSEDFEGPGALKLDGEGAAYVHDGDVIKKLVLETGETSIVAELPSEADNLALGPEGRLFVSLAEENAIVEVDVGTGGVDYVVGPSLLNSPAGLAAAPDGAGADTLYVGDLFGGVRVVDAGSGSVDHTPVDMFQPTHVYARGDGLIVANEVFGDVWKLDRATFEVRARWSGFEQPGDVLESGDGALIVAETGTGRLLHVSGPDGAERRVVAAGLESPHGLAWADDGTSVFVSETAAGRLLRVDVGSGRSEVVASGLRGPEGVAVDREGRVLVVEVGAKRLQRFAAEGGTGTVVAADLPIGLSNGPSLYRGLAVGDGGIYFSSDVDNTIYRIRAD